MQKKRIRRVLLQNRQRRIKLDIQKIRDALYRYEPHIIRSLYEISVLLVSDKSISQFHKKFLGISGPTDVLSFKIGPNVDILISVDTAARQAIEAEHSIEKEIFYLLLHGILHCSGYNDSTHSSRDRMLRAQDVLCAEYWSDSETE